MHADFYLRGREGSTMAAYDLEFKKFLRFCGESGRLVWEMRQRDIASFLIWRSMLGVSESQVRQGMAAINLLCEVCGFESPFKSPLVSKVKLAVLKQANEGKRKVVRIGMTKRILEKIMKACYRKNFKEVIPEKEGFSL